MLPVVRDGERVVALRDLLLKHLFPDRQNQIGAKKSTFLPRNRPKFENIIVISVANYRDTDAERGVHGVPVDLDGERVNQLPPPKKNYAHGFGCCLSIRSANGLSRSERCFFGFFSRPDKNKLVHQRIVKVYSCIVKTCSCIAN